ncbi:MAG: hypothetical protein ACR2PF_21075, partial [Rhizobiaceae bacterium]
MPTTTGHFSNTYDFTIAGQTSGYENYFCVIEQNAIAVINYLSDFISWQGDMEFVVHFGTPQGNGLLPSYGNIAPDGATAAASEAQSGIDPYPSDYDAGLNLIPASDGSLQNFGVPLHFDPSPDPYAQYSPPAGTNDFFSIFLHEVVHAFGFWSLAQHGPGAGTTDFDDLTEFRSGSWYFTGTNTNALLGQDLRLAATGSRDHYGGVDTAIGQTPGLTRGLMFEFGNYEQNRWHLGQIDLAMLKDLGWTVANESALALTELSDSSPNVTGSNLADTLFGDHQQNQLAGDGGDDLLVGGLGNDSLDGGSGNDLLLGGLGSDSLIGGEGFDTAFYGNSGSVTVNLGGGANTGGEAAGDTFATVENVRGSAFNDTITGDALANALIGQG